MIIGDSNAVFFFKSHTYQPLMPSQQHNKKNKERFGYDDDSDP